jgi:hypothetical protein
MKSFGEHLGNKLTAPGPQFEVLTAEELASRWRVPQSWIREGTRSRCKDVIPHYRLGKYTRFLWGSPQLTEWWNRHLVGSKRAACE